MLCPSERQLVASHLHVVAGVAQRLARSLSSQADLDDMISDGVLGLISAAQSYDPTRKVKFKTFAAPRVRGAILDGLRAQMPQSRLSNHRWAVVEACKSQFFAEHGRRPSDRELAGLLRKRGIKARQIPRFLAWASGYAQTQSMGSVIVMGERGPVTVADTLVDAGADPMEAADRRDLVAVMTEGFDRHERAIFCLYFLAGMTMREAGEMVGFCESRVSQMIKSLLRRLRASPRLEALAGGRGPRRLSPDQIRTAALGIKKQHNRSSDRRKDGRSRTRQGCRRTDADDPRPEMEPGRITQDGKRRAMNLPNPSPRPSCRRKEAIQIQRSVA